MLERKYHNFDRTFTASSAGATWFSILSILILCVTPARFLMYQSIPSLTIPPRATSGDSHILVPLGSGFRSSVLPGVLNQSKSSIILEKGAIFALSLKQMGSGSFHMFIYARSEQCDSGPIYTITNTQRIRIYPGKLKFIPVKISPDPGRLHGKHGIENQILLYSRFLLLRIYLDSPVHTSANTKPIQICPVML